MKREIEALQKIMKEKNIDAFICPTSDEHQSEYIGEHDKAREYLSGFDGSAGTLLITKEEAFLWTDGRYFVQAQKQLKGSGIELMKQGEKGVLSLNEWLKTNLLKDACIAFNAKVMSIKEVNELKEDLKEKNIKFKTDEDLVAYIWEDRPGIKASDILILGEMFAGEKSIKKIERVRENIKKEKGESLILSALGDIAWLTNLRAYDIECNPFFMSFMYISKERVILFARKKAVSKEVEKYLQDSSIELREYEEFYSFVEALKGEKIVIDDKECNYRIYELVKGDNKIICNALTVAKLKNVKNDIEIANMKRAHIRDGVYLTKFIKWLKDEIKSGKELNEYEAGAYMDKLRSEDLKFLQLSFETISAYGKNAAMPHYKAPKEGCAKLENRGLYLIDSGAHYLDGTTDVTRTISIGEITDEERLHYTLCVIGMLRLLNAKFPRGSKGYNLDTYARSKMWEYGLDYNHGTGHGVGFCNGVHEAPLGIRVKASADKDRELSFVEGMIVSDEPGIYIEGKHGIRMEILVVSKRYKDDFLEFEALTLAPIDKSAIDTSIMSKEDIENYNAYQAKVYETLNSYLDEETREWLRNETKSIA